MIDVEKDLQSAYDYGYRQGVKDTLDDIYKTLERLLREKFAHLIKTEPNSKVSETPTSSEKPNNCEAKNYCDDCLYTDTCDSKEFFYACTSKATISKMEQVEDETKTQMKTQNSNLTFEKADEPQTDCAWK